MWQSIKNIYHLAVSVLANVWYGWPSKRLTVIGVTGTDGKTTTVSFIYHILKTAGKKACMISSTGALIGEKEYDIGFHVTTPSPFALQSFLKKAIEKKSTHMVLEVTSHALDQYRVWGIDFAVGVLTNVTHEHLDYHKTYENYVKTKAKLLQMAKKAVINRDDESYKIISKLKAQKSKLQLKTQNFITYGIRQKADVIPKIFPFKTKLIGEFNRYNCLAAIATCKSLGVPDSVIRRALLTFKLPIGRAEIVYRNNFQVMIDFAHTPNALEQILNSIKPKVKGRLIHVFGSAGKRDYMKRPKMGKISARYADIIVLTAEDPRGEPVGEIMGEIAKGIVNSKLKIENSNGKWKLGNGKSLMKIPDRQEAIATSINMAKKGDLVLITGKGHEKSMNLGHGEEPWSEHKAVKEALSTKSEVRNKFK